MASRAPDQLDSRFARQITAMMVSRHGVTLLALEKACKSGPNPIPLASYLTYPEYIVSMGTDQIIEVARKAYFSAELFEREKALLREADTLLAGSARNCDSEGTGSAGICLNLLSSTEAGDPRRKELAERIATFMHDRTQAVMAEVKRVTEGDYGMHATIFAIPGASEQSKQALYTEMTVFLGSLQMSLSFNSPSSNPAHRDTEQMFVTAPWTRDPSILRNLKMLDLNYELPILDSWSNPN
jgi:hypothetical protein